MTAIADARGARLDEYWSVDRLEHRMKDSQTLRTQFRVSDFITWQRDKALMLNPNFQRRPVWKKGAKSFLIDTILRGLPMPIIFIRDLRANLKTFKSTRDVVDGQQRIRTIFSFIDPSLLGDDFLPARDEFTISETHNEELGGKGFNDLDSEYQQRILDYQFSVHSFPADTDDRAILQIFARMNSTGVKANAQELRNAEFKGPFKTLAYEIATEQLNQWRDWKIFTPDQIARMNEVELTSEFMVLMLQGIMEKKNTTLDSYYKKYENEKKLPFEDKNEVSLRFRKTFSTIGSTFDKAKIARLFGSRTIFYSLFAAFYGLQYGLRSPSKTYGAMGSQKASAINSSVIEHIGVAGEQIASGKVPQRVLKALRGATTHASERRVVIKHLVGEDNDPCPTL